MAQDFSSVTEISGDEVSVEQVNRLAQRYYWAGGYCQDNDVLEVACGAGQGLGYLEVVSRSLRAGDISPSLVEKARSVYGTRIDISEMDAENLPFDENCLDVIILFEAIYYLHSAERFIDECRRVLRPEGILLLATANRDLFDFNPSPFSVKYYNPVELGTMLSNYGFETRFFGGSPAKSQSFKGRILRLLKKAAVTFNLIPGSMQGKRWLKRIVFGKLVPMPYELRMGEFSYQPPQPIEGSIPDTTHQVLYCAAKIK